MGFFDRSPKKPVEPPTSEAQPQPEKQEAGLFARFRQGLKRTSDLLQTDIRDLFKQEGASPAALIVVHSQNMSSEEQLEVLRQGAWVSLDGVRESDESIERYVKFIKSIKTHGFLDKVLISQDNYWSVEEKEGNTYLEFHGSSYSAILDKLRKRLVEEDFTATEFTDLLSANPAKAFAVEKLPL